MSPQVWALTPALICGGDGKTVLVVNELLDQAIRNDKRNPQYAYIAPTYGAAKRIAWQMFKDYAQYLPEFKANEADLRIEFKNAHNHTVKIFLLGAENPGSIRGVYLDGVILDEYAECDPIIWTQVLRPALSDRLGWAIFIGTPKGQNHFYDIYHNALKQDKNWFVKMYKASETGIVSKSELEAALASGMSEEEYAQEFECSFAAALVGAYFGKELEKAEAQGRVCSVPYEKHAPVWCAWDLGIGDSTAIWCGQQVGKEIHLIDYIESHGQSLDWYVKELKSRDYLIEGHYLPHDAAARELQTGKSRVESLRQLGCTNATVLPRHRLEDGLSAVRMVLSKCWFDRVRCEAGISALKNYQKRWNAKEKAFSNSPLHNWASHGADAFRYFVMGFRDDGYYESRKSLPRQAETDYDIYNYGGRQWADQAYPRNLLSLSRHNNDEKI